jgi:hypothetical protein
MPPIRRVDLDVLKPHEPPMVSFVSSVGEAPTVESVGATLVELDREVQNLALAVAGEDLDVEAVEAAVDDLGGTVHSVDQVACGERDLLDGAPPGGT